MPRLTTALLFQAGNFVGREYFRRLAERGRVPDVVAAVGEMKPESVAREIARTGGLWNPPAIPAGVPVARFERLADPALVDLLRGVDVAIQGGVGILKGDTLAAPRLGWLNVHPGRLPQYRGNACPEWAVLAGDEVWASAHLIDAGIDTGPVVHAGRYDVGGDWSYAMFRANLYAHCAGVLIAALDRLERAADPATVPRPQDEAAARYWPAMGEADHARVVARFPLAGAAA